MSLGNGAKVEEAAETNLNKDDFMTEYDDYMTEYTEEKILELAIAARRGDVQAQADLGRLYYNYSKSEKVPIDLRTKGKINAVIYYSMAAEQGHAEAQCFLGMAFYYGEGVPQDKPKGLQWLKKAAEKGDKAAFKAYNNLCKAQELAALADAGRKAMDSLQTKENKCFIASAVYGPFALETNILREWRDKKLLSHLPGRILTNFYYFVSPSLCKLILRHKSLKVIIRKFLDYFVVWISR